MKYVKLYEQWKMSQKFGKRINEEEKAEAPVETLSEEDVNSRKESLQSFMNMSISAFLKTNEQRQRQLFSNCINYTFDTVPMAEGGKVPFVKGEFKKEGKELQFIKSVNSAKANWAKVRFTISVDPETYGGDLNKLKNISCAALRLNVSKDDNASEQLTIDLGTFVRYMAEYENSKSFFTTLKEVGVKTALNNTEEKLRSITKLDKPEEFLLSTEKYAKADFSDYKIGSSNIDKINDEIKQNITPKTNKKPVPAE